MHSFSNWGDVIRRIIKPAFIAMLLTISSTEAAFAKLNYTSGETSDGLRYIVVNGEFEYSDNLSEFSDKASLQKPSFIGFNSGGGNVIKAMELGRLIRSHRLSTVQLKGPECSSACALAFLGGVGRIAEPGAIGVHKSSFSAEDAIDTQTAVSAVQELTAEVITYIIEMGADPALLQLSLRYDKDDIRYLSRSEMHHYKVITSISSQRKTVSRLPVPFREQSGTITESERVLSSKPEEDIIEFVRRYHSAWSSNNRASLHFIEQAYAKKVDFYGKLMSREAVIEEKNMVYESLA